MSILSISVEVSSLRIHFCDTSVCGLPLNKIQLYLCDNNTIESKALIESNKIFRIEIENKRFPEKWMKIQNGVKIKSNYIMSENWFELFMMMAFWKAWKN